MQFTMKNVFALVAIPTIALWQGIGVATASPTPSQARGIINALETYISSGVEMPDHYKPFDPSALRDDTAVEIVTTEDEAFALSEHYGHKIRIDTAAGELIYVLVPDDDKPAQHVGTLRGEVLDLTLDKIDHRLQQEKYVAENGTTAADVGLNTQMGCARFWCISSIHCIAWKQGCGACIIFWCA